MNVSKIWTRIQRLSRSSFSNELTDREILVINIIIIDGLLGVASTQQRRLTFRTAPLE